MVQKTLSVTLRGLDDTHTSGAICQMGMIILTIDQYCFYTITISRNRSDLAHTRAVFYAIWYVFLGRKYSNLKYLGYTDDYYIYFVALPLSFKFLCKR